MSASGHNRLVMYHPHISQGNVFFLVVKAVNKAQLAHSKVCIAKKQQVSFLKKFAFDKLAKQIERMEQLYKGTRRVLVIIQNIYRHKNLLSSEQQRAVDSIKHYEKQLPLKQALK